VSIAITSGEVCEIGDLEDDQPGFRLKTADGRVVTVIGLTRDEVRNCIPAFKTRAVMLFIAGDEA
jgi:hypothetical protein